VFVLVEQEPLLCHLPQVKVTYGSLLLHIPFVGTSHVSLAEINLLKNEDSFF
jgi:hypothetical protein